MLGLFVAPPVVAVFQKTDYLRELLSPASIIWGRSSSLEEAFDFKEEDTAAAKAAATNGHVDKYSKRKCYLRE